jgi:phage repressor protein C with HTH and peptisase S24 domain
MNFSANAATQKFIADIEALRKAGVVRFDSEIVERIGVQKSNFSAIMNGKRNAPEDMLKAFYKAYKKELADNKLSGPKSTAQANAILLDAQDYQVMMVPLVNKYAYAGYQSGYGDDEYVDTLPRVPFMVDKQHRGHYCAFEVKGDSMDNGLIGSYKEGYIVLGREIPKNMWRDKLHIKKWRTFIVVTKTDGILIKQISKHDTERGIITLHSLNEEYDDIQLQLDKVAQLFNVVQVNSKE